MGVWGVYMGHHLCSPLCVYVKALKGVQQKADFSAATSIATYYYKQDLSTLVPRAKVLGSMSESLNTAFLLSIGLNELADASRSLCAKVSIPSQRVNGAAACGRMECSCHWLE